MLVLDTVHKELVGVISRGVVPNVILLSLDIGYQLGIVAREIGMHDMASKVAASLTTLPELPNLEVDPLVEARYIIIEIGNLASDLDNWVRIKSGSTVVSTAEWLRTTLSSSNPHSTPWTWKS